MLRERYLWWGAGKGALRAHCCILLCDAPGCMILSLLGKKGGPHPLELEGVLLESGLSREAGWGEGSGQSFGDTSLPSPSPRPQGWIGSGTQGGELGREKGSAGTTVSTGGAKLTSRVTLGRRLKLFLIS